MSSGPEVWTIVSAVAGAISALAALGALIVARRTIVVAREAADDQARQASRAAEEQAAHSRQLVELQIGAMRASAREKTANETYNDYLGLCIQYPQLSSYALAAKEFGFPPPTDVVKACVVGTEQYLWFVSYLLNACEKIIDDSPEAEGWHFTIRDQLRYHKEILREAWPDWECHYSEQLRPLVRQVIESSDD